MALTSLDSIINSLGAGQGFRTPFQKVSSNGATSAANRYHELFTGNGIPAAGSFAGAAGVGVAMSRATQGAMNLGSTPGAGQFQHLLNMLAFSPTATGNPARIMVLDLLAYYPSLVVTGSPTALTPVALPRYADGAGVMAFVAVQTALGAAQPSVQLNYTRQDGASGRVATAVLAPAASLPVSTFLGTTGPFVPLQGTDTGVRSVNSYVIGGAPTTGTVAIVLAKVIAEIPILVANQAVERDFLSQIPSLPLIETGACLSLAVGTGAAMVASALFFGSLETVWG